MKDRARWAWCWICYTFYFWCPLGLMSRWLENAVLPFAGEYAYSEYGEDVAAQGEQDERSE